MPQLVHAPYIDYKIKPQKQTLRNKKNLAPPNRQSPSINKVNINADYLPLAENKFEMKLSAIKPLGNFPSLAVVNTNTRD